MCSSCSDDDTNTKIVKSTDVSKNENGDSNSNGDANDNSDYEAPDYWDDYSLEGIGSWSNRKLWNLANVHDPSVAELNGYYYMIGTDASYGNSLDGHGHFFMRYSEDLVNWKWLGSTMNEAPSWALDSVNSIRNQHNVKCGTNLSDITDPVYSYWAPCIRTVDGKIRMYYSIPLSNYIGNGEPSDDESNFDNTWSERAFIGLMETDDPMNGEWTDKGMVVCSVSDRNGDWYRSSLSNYDAYFKYNAIDPSYIVAPNGEHWLVYGSWHSGIVAIELDPNTGLPLNKFDVMDESTWGTQIYTRDNTSRWQASEGPEIIYNKETDYYYLFLAYDELSVAYNTRVCRSQSITGPYFAYNGTNITDGGGCWPMLTHPYKFKDHSGWVGISHCTVFCDETNDQWYYCSQGRLPANTNGNSYSNSIMMGHVRKIVWTEDGWPVVLPERYAAVPQDEITEDDLVGTWENIFLEYQYQTQQSSDNVALSSDNTLTGAITGNWSYNEETYVLTLGSCQVIVQRELDWEADPREPTIVYAGLDDTGMSVWGKKIE